MNKPVNLAAVEKIITEVALSEIMPRFRTLATGDIEMKGVDDPVTVADKAAEAALIARLTDAFPNSLVVGEESFAAAPDILAHFDGEKDVWVIDPIDGTRNFISGKPEFAVMVAQVRRRQTIGAWIHDPNSGDTLKTEKGSGVWLGNHKMRLAGQDLSIPTVGLAGSKLRRFLATPAMAATVAGLPPLAPGSAAAFDYGRLFAGEALFAKSNAARASLLVTYRRAMPWDHMAGLLMLHEAGGHSGDWYGKPYDASTPTQGLISASDPETWHRLHGLLSPVLLDPGAP